MKPPPFAYADPGSVPEALELLAEYGDEGKILAGGQSLVPLLNMRLAQPQVLVDLNRVPELSFIREEARNGTPGIAIGAMTRQRMVEDSTDIPQRIPLLREAIGWVGHPQIRNRGTIGGSIAHADPAAELPLVFVTLDGVATIRSGEGKREVAAADFFQYTFTSAVEPHELLASVWLPISPQLEDREPSGCGAPAPARTGQAFLEVARRHGDFALVAVAVSLTLSDGGEVTDVRIAVGGAAPVPVRADAAERALRGQRISLELFREAADLTAAAMEPTSDLHADADYRREVAGTLTYRALQTAWGRIPKGDA